MCVVYSDWNFVSLTKIMGKDFSFAKNVRGILSAYKKWCVGSVREGGDGGFCLSYTLSRYMYQSLEITFILPTVAEHAVLAYIGLRAISLKEGKNICHVSEPSEWLKYL